STLTETNPTTYIAGRKKLKGMGRGVYHGHGPIRLRQSAPHLPPLSPLSLPPFPPSPSPFLPLLPPSSPLLPTQKPLIASPFGPQASDAGSFLYGTRAFPIRLIGERMAVLCPDDRSIPS